MSKKGLFFSEIIEAIGKKEENNYLKETKRIQKKIAFDNIKPPKSLDKKINQMITDGSRKRKQKSINLKIAVFLLVFIIACQTIYIMNPQIAMAVRYTISKLFSFQSEKSLDIQLQNGKDFWENYEWNIPDEFELQPDTSSAFDTEKRVYKNKKDQYIQFNLYPANFLVSEDIEKCESVEDVNIKEYPAKCITKKGMTTILIFIDDKLLEVESNLSIDEIKEIVESIHTNK